MEMTPSAIELFRTACGLSAPLHLAIRKPSSAAGRSIIHQFEQPFAIVGRDAVADLVLQDGQISRRHAYLQAISGRILCVDLHSRTKMRWEGETGLRERGWLAPSREIWMGPYSLRWADVHTTTPEGNQDAADLMGPGPSSLDSESLCHASLALPLRHDGDESAWKIKTRVALVGRSESCHLVLGHESVSRFHASLIRTNRGLWVVDLLAREGVHVNGQCVRWAWLEDGDTIRFGRFTFVVRYETPPAQICRSDVPLDAGARRLPARPAGAAVPDPLQDTRGRGLAIRPHLSRHAPLAAIAPVKTSAPVMLERAAPDQWELSGAIPGPQLAMWQQQMRMMESFHSDMMMMVQMFMAMHKEHRESFQDELDKVRDLSQELTRLQEKLATPPDLPGPGKPQNGDLSAVQTRSVTTGLGTEADLAAATASIERILSGAGARPASPPSFKPAPLNPSGTSASSEEPVLKEVTEPRPAMAEASRFHLDITRRINDLQRERQGYWQRILSAINKQSN